MGVLAPVLFVAAAMVHSWRQDGMQEALSRVKGGIGMCQVVRCGLDHAHGVRHETGAHLAESIACLA